MSYIKIKYIRNILQFFDEDNNMEEKQSDINNNKEISPRHLLNLLMPIIKDELIAQCRYDREGIRIKFVNGQIFHLTVSEIK